MFSLDDKSSLLIYRVGPVYCCSPSLPVDNISIPSPLTHPPGSSTGHPGIFRHGKHIVSVSDLRFQFGVNQDEWQTPGRMVITRLADSYTGFWVDEIIDVMRFPESGWGNLPAQLPRGIFTRTLLLKEQIHLYAEFDKLATLKGGGYLRQYLSSLQPPPAEKELAAPVAENTEPGKVQQPQSHNVDAQKPVQAHAAEANAKPAPATATATMTQGAMVARPVKDGPLTGNTAPAPASTRSTVPASRDTGMTLRRETTPLASSPALTGRHQATTKNEITTRRVSTIRSPVTTSQVQHSEERQVVPTQASNEETSNLVLLAGLLVFILAMSGLGYLAYEMMIPAAAGKKVVTYSQPEPVVLNEREPEQEVPAPTNEVVTDAPVFITQQEETTAEEKQTVIQPPSYQATIEQDEEGFTIVLNPPKKISTDIEQPAGEDPQERSSSSPENNGGNNSENKTVTTQPATRTIAAPRRIETIHVVVKGDTLWDIARKYVDDPFLYPELARLSNIRNPHRIYPGNKVRIIRYLDQN